MQSTHMEKQCNKPARSFQFEAGFSVSWCLFTLAPWRTSLLVGFKISSLSPVSLYYIPSCSPIFSSEQRDGEFWLFLKFGGCSSQESHLNLLSVDPDFFSDIRIYKNKGHKALPTYYILRSNNAPWEVPPKVEASCRYRLWLCQMMLVKL